MRIQHILFCALFILVNLHVYSNNPVEQFVQHPVFRHANISILVKDLSSNKTIYAHRADKAVIPASTVKVITTATALELFGPDFRYKTEIAYDGILQDNGELNGNLYIIGSGDPTLGSSKLGDQNFLTKWVVAVKQAGITKINGRIVVDESKFDNEGANPKWTWDDIGNYYAPGIYALAYLDNTLRVTFRSKEAGTTPEIVDITPAVPGLTINNNLLSSQIRFDSAYFYGSPKQLNRTVRGEIPANRPGFVVKAELPDPGLQLAHDFQNLLQSQGIGIKNPSIHLKMDENTFPQNTQRDIIYTHLSVPLREIIKETNENSNNFYAEQLFKSISVSQHAVATNKRSIDIIRSFWKSKGLDVSQLFQTDGSGLSPTNAVSAAFFVDLMHYMYHTSPYKKDFFNSLARAGKTGTLAGVLKETPLNGKVFAKSGTIARVRCYTGFIMQSNKSLIFAVMVNNANTNSWQTLSRIEELLVQISKM